MQKRQKNAQKFVMHVQNSELGEFEVPAISKEDRIPLGLPFPFTLPRLFRNPANSTFFPFPLELRNSGVRLYVILHVPKLLILIPQ